jgi:hypothetical protein
MYKKGDRIGPLMGIETHGSSVPGEQELDAVEPEDLHCVHKLQKTWDGKRELLEEPDGKTLEARGGYPTNNCLQVSTNTSEPKRAEVRKGDVCDDWRMSDLSLHIMIGNRE